MPSNEQFEFASLGFPKDRSVLSIRDLAIKLDVTNQHVGDLIEEGKILAINVGGAGLEWFRAPLDFLKLISKRTGLDEETLMQLLEQSRASGTKPGTHVRKSWRIPVESYIAFLKQQNSFSTLADLPDKKS
ncbi:MAG: hypothetical protein JWQ71_4471 [Pedosphaera sp.]|nr:hypothetical protein [Pedosphaera sp.]